MKKVAITLVVLATIGAFLPGASDEQKAVWAEEKAQAQLIAQQEQAERQAKAKATAEANAQKGFHCLSGWDGSHRMVARTVEKNLKDPDSFKHRETKIWPKDVDGNHMLMMTYSGTNGFGGTSVERVRAKISNSSCAVISITQL